MTLIHCQEILDHTEQTLEQQQELRTEILMILMDLYLLTSFKSWYNSFGRSWSRTNLVEGVDKNFILGEGSQTSNDSLLRVHISEVEREIEVSQSVENGYSPNCHFWEHFCAKSAISNVVTNNFTIPLRQSRGLQINYCNEERCRQKYNVGHLHRSKQRSIINSLLFYPIKTIKPTTCMAVSELRALHHWSWFNSSQ